MLWELALFSILVPTAYWGVMYVRRRPFGSAVFGGMLLATAALATLALATGHRGVAVVAIGAGVVQLFVAPLLRAGARWAVSRDHLRLATFLVEVRDLLQPGMGGKEDLRMVAALRDVKEGRVDTALAALARLRERAPAGARPAIDERIVLLYLSARRWDDAIAWADRTVFADERPGEVRPLPVSPSVFVELITARLRVGDFDRAAELAESFEDAAKNVPELTLLVFRLHLVFLAHAGRVDDVDRLVDPRLATYVTPAARRFWAGVARRAAGDVAGARAALDEARSLAGGDRNARALIDETAAAVDTPPPPPTPRALEVADRMAQTPPAIPARAPARRNTVTAALVVANLIVAALAMVFLAGPGDLGSIVRAGANVRSLVDHGETWRLASSVFVHVGLIHLIVNVLALWSLGRLVEGLFGRARMLAIYGVAGILGALASHLGGQAGVSAGASGAIFGLLGAALIELALHGRRYRRDWRRSLLGALVVVTVAQLAIGFHWTMIDQWAHVGGLVVGIVVGALLSPGWRWAQHRAVAWSAIALAVAVVAAFAWAGVEAARTDYADSLAAQPKVPLRGADFTVQAPVSWEAVGTEVGDPSLNVVVQLVASTDPEGELAAWDEDARSLAVERGFGAVDRASDVAVPLPAGWHGTEYVVTAKDELMSTQRFRLVLFRGPGLLGLVFAPDVLVRDAGATFAAILATAP